MPKKVDRRHRVEEGVRFEVLLPRREYEHLEFLGRVIGAGKGAVMRILVTASLEKFEGSYDSLPTPEALATAYAALKAEKETYTNG